MPAKVLCVSSFAAQMCLHNVYANIMYAFCTATPTDTEQVITSRTDVLNGNTTALEDKMEGCGGEVEERSVVFSR